MLRLINLSAVILVIVKQVSTLRKPNIEELFYPIQLPGHPLYIPNQSKGNGLITPNPKLRYLQNLLATATNNNDDQDNKKNRLNRISVFDSPIHENHEESGDHKILTLQGLSLDTITAGDKSNQNKESHRITVFESSKPTKYEEDQENKNVLDQGLTIDTIEDQANQNGESHKVSVFKSSIPTKYDEDHDHRQVLVQGLTIDSVPGGHAQAYPKQKLHRISVFDAPVQRKQEEVEESKEIPLQGFSIPVTEFNEVNPEIYLHRVSVFDSLPNNKQPGQKEGIEDEEKDVYDVEDGEEQNETEEMESLEDKFISKTSIGAPYKQENAQRNQNKGLHRISVFDSNILSNSEDEDEANIKDTTRPETVQKHRHELPNHYKGFHHISVFDATRFDPEPVPIKGQTLLEDRNSQENSEKGLKRIPVLDSSLPNKGTYRTYFLDEDLPPKHISTVPENINQAILEKKLHEKRSRKKRLKKKKLEMKKSKKSKFVYGAATISEYGDYLAHVGDNSTVADAMTRRVRVLCWIMTYPENHKKKARHVKETWGKRCNKLLFMSTEEDSNLPTVKLPVTEDYNHLWGKTKAAFQYIHKHHLNDAEWFLKADDDTYVIVENLRYMLADYNSNDPIYFGFRFQASFCPKQGYTSGGAGYVLSKEALNRFVKQALPSDDLCKKDNTGAEDAEMGKCLERTGVMLMDSRDYYKRNRFFPFLPHDHIDQTVDPEYWFWKMIYYPMETGRDCCSEYAISFHYVDPGFMYAMEYFVYHLRPYGISYQFDAINNNIIK